MVHFNIENIEVFIKKACRPLLDSRSLEVITDSASEKGGMAELDRSQEIISSGLPYFVSE
jgi:hypothetical protein